MKALLLLSLLVGFIKAECPSEVIIVGAGIAGLAAAKHLVENECNVTILEAGSRIGGRIYSVDVGPNYTTDLGASFIHGIGPSAGDLEDWKEMYNPLYEIVYDN